jgi:KaiC/GvpD/RAD55 family RecA-like ATPase
MGKTLLVDKILDRASQEGYKTAILSFEEADSEVLGDYRKLLQWLCVTLGDLLELENKLVEYWDDIFRRY